MYEIRKITRYEYSWLTSHDFFNLFSQLTQCTLIDSSDFVIWFKEMINNPLFIMFGVIDSNPPTPGAKLVGIGSMYIHSRYYRKMAKSAHLEDIVIDGNHRRKGLGKQLVSKMILYAQEINCYKIQLTCEPELRTFYEKLEFSNNKECMEQLFDYKSIKRKAIEEKKTFIL